MYKSIFERPPSTWSTSDVIQFLLLDTVNMPYLATMVQEHGIDGQSLMRQSVDDLTSKYKLRSQDASKLINQLARFSARFAGSNHASLLPGERLIPASIPSAFPQPWLFEQSHVLPPADVAARAAQQEQEESRALQYVPVLLPSNNPAGWYGGDVYGVSNDTKASKSGVGGMWYLICMVYTSTHVHQSTHTYTHIYTSTDTHVHINTHRIFQTCK